MYAAPAPKSECCLSASLHEYDVRCSDSLDEQLRRPTDLGDQRIGFDAELVQILGLPRHPRVLAELNLVAGDKVRALVRFSGIDLTINALVQNHLVSAIRGQVEPR